MLTSSWIKELHSGVLSLHEYLAQIEMRYEQQEPQIYAFIPEKDRFRRLQAEAQELMNRFPDPDDRPRLFGSLAGIKDIFHVEGFETRAGSRLPAEALQGREAESVSLLKKAGILILGKTVTTEFAYFTPGPTRNPHNVEHTPGGSSSGSAAAVAAGLCQIALGTQTIGSIIRPASFCGVVGVKPTYDRISREGVIPLSPSLDHIGFFTPDIETAIHFAPLLYKEWRAPTLPLRRPRIGIPAGSYLQSASEENLAHLEKAVQLLKNADYELQRIRVMPDFAEIRQRHELILAAEAAQVHAAWFEEYGELYTSRFAELIQRGQQVTREQLHSASKSRDQFRADVRRTFLDHNIDLWVCPSTPDAAPKGLQSTGDPIMNLPWTQAGLPAINLPAGKNRDGLPLGLQLIGNWYKDESLLLWAKELEKVLVSL
jgi:Asp-tRNA(Asn)/Glu-tRNA(Gln) amidotransferase A subunit family amidase